jgi:PKD repeat protein
VETVRQYSEFVLPYSAEFTAETVAGTAPLTVSFTDLSTPWGWVDSWQWDFGDGQSSTEANPTHIYTRTGVYSVSLTTTAGLTTYTALKPAYITVTTSAGLVAAFSASPLSGAVPLTVTFTGQSSGQVMTRTWDFGDGITQTLTATNIISHIYATPGLYTASLTITGPAGSDALLQPHYITALEAIAKKDRIYLPLILRRAGNRNQNYLPIIVKQP